MRESASPGAVISHWYKLFENFQASTLDFYASVESAIQKRRIPDCQTSRVDWHEGGVFSARREYLRVTRGIHIFDICGAPFGTGFFVSSWLARRESSYGPIALLVLLISLFFITSVSFQRLGFSLGLFFIFIGLPMLFWGFVHFMNKQQEGWDDALVAMPFLGRIYERIFRPETYYRIDTALMFQQSVHNAVLEVIDEITSTQGVRALSEFERKPLLREFARK